MPSRASIYLSCKTFIHTYQHFRKNYYVHLSLKVPCKDKFSIATELINRDFSGAIWDANALKETLAGLKFNYRLLTCFRYINFC